MGGPGGDGAVRRARDRRDTTTVRRPVLPPPSTAAVIGLDTPTISTAEALHRRPIEAPIVISIETVVVGDDADSLWTLYEESIGPLDDVAAMKHLDSEEQILGLFAEPRITKIIAWDGGEPIGLGLITNDLDLVPEASPAYLRSQYPEHAASDRIFYGMAVLVRSTRRGLTVFPRVYLSMWQIPARVGGVLVFDMCKFNRDTFDGDSLVDGIAANFPNSSWRVLDQQTWYAAELPNALPDNP